MSTDDRSKKRVNTPDEGSSRARSFHGVARSETLADVASILDEIEGIVSSSGSLKAEKPGTPERTTPVRQAPPDEDSATRMPEEQSIDFDMNQLEAEMESAIASELGENTVAPSQGTGTEASTGEPMGTPFQAVQEATMEQVVDVVDLHDDFEQWELEPRVRPLQLAGKAFFRTAASPVEKLSDRDRLLVNVTVLSLLFWVPIVWVLAV